MKKNDVMGYVVYALMIAIACIVAFVVIRPIFSDTSYANVLPMNGFVFVLLAILAGYFLGAILIELGHLLGAKIGKYKIISLNILGLCFSHKADGSRKVGFASFDGLTGETRVVPLDVKKSNPRHMISMPLVLFLLEVIACVTVMVISKVFVSQDDLVWIWGYVFALVTLAVSGVLYLYDIFPAQLDGKNDGYLIPILTNQTNTEAYNRMLVAEDRLANGLSAGDMPVYESVTDFTSRVNDVKLYEDLKKGDYQDALRIVELTIKCKKDVSSRVYGAAISQKVAITLMSSPLEEAKSFYIALPLEDKKHVASLSCGPSVRAYILVSGLIEDSLSETEAAMDHADAAIKASGSDKKPIEEKLVKEAVEKVLAVHPDWDLSAYGFKAAPKEKEPVKEDKEIETPKDDKKKD